MPAPRHRRRTALPQLLVAGLLTPAAAFAQDKPLPPVDTLRARAIATAKQAELDRERYSCRFRSTTDQEDGKGRTKESTVEEDDIFFVHGYQVTRTVSRNGRPLSQDEIAKQDKRVRKEVEDAEKSHRDGKPPQANPVAAQHILRTARLSNERRILVAGRPTIVFDVLENTDSHSGKLEDRFIAALRGTVSIDEATGVTQDLNVTGARDVKVGGGLVANVHKGFHAHVVAAPEPNASIWFIHDIYGGGDARVGLFFHPAGQFHSQLQSCHLYDVTTDQTVAPPEEKK